MLTQARTSYLRAEFSVLPYLLSLLPTVVVVAGNLLGGYYALAYAVFALVGLVALDWILPANHAKPSKLPLALPDVIMWLAVLCHTASVFSLLYGVYAGILAGKFIWFAAISTGFNSGIMGITAAHELIHRKEKLLRNLGIWNLFLSNYSHFYTEHRFGHHLRVGTWDDPVTARYNEGFYRFFVRAFTGQIRSAWQIEAKRLEKKGKNPLSPENFVLRAFSLQIFFLAALYFIGGWPLMLAHAAQSVVGFSLLEFVNYIEHYGLIRAKGEKVGVMHSWQSDRVSSRFMLYELSRHSDHHLKAYKPFHTLESHEEAYTLPSGYFGMFYIGLIPPLWFRMVNPILDRGTAAALDRKQ